MFNPMFNLHLMSNLMVGTMTMLVIVLVLFVNCAQDYKNKWIACPERCWKHKNV